jgi:anti-anti-sigma factor
LEIKIIKREERASLLLSGRFDFYTHRDFKKAYMQLIENKELSTITVDLKEIVYLDSSAMGMLLLLKEAADLARKKVLINCGTNTFVRDLLSAVSFTKIFEIS